jgi:hypothetical protein
MRRVKIAIALGAAVVGAALPWRARIVYSEALGWMAQLVPPRFYQVREGGDDPTPR